ncbi:MAG TPA: hydrogenase iron-sulfur subunit [Paracoccus sp.]|nr:hydrogenase iron-sulfur subunit [Paracoccus sp. (in: a-proteobacteria)]
MMAGFRTILRRGFDRAERGLDRIFGADWNPLANLGPLGWFLFWIVAVSGIYLFIFWDTGVHASYASVERITHEHWWHAGLARSLHRYASDLMVLMMVLHLVREWARDRYRGKRWFSWVTGVPIIWFVYLSGITGYWLVWDQLAQYVAITATELLDSLGIFAEPIARNFLAPDHLSSRFFTLMVFLHIAIPLMLLLAMWIHTQRITDARTSPPTALSLVTLAGLVAASFVLPALSQGEADLSRVPQEVGIDWFYLPLFPLAEVVPPGVIWAGVGLFSVLMIGLPWMPPRREAPAAEVHLPNCNGCMRCVNDCPYSAITVEPRSDGLPFPREVKVHPERCVACGICMGSCPSSTPFRRSEGLKTGIDLPGYSLAELRTRVIAAAGALPAGPGRVLTLACAHGAGGDDAGPAAPGVVRVPCAAMPPPSMIDFIISRGLADGVAIAGCAERDCQHRFGVAWSKARIERTRDPMLRERVPRERLLSVWAGPSEPLRLKTELAAFSERLAGMAPYDKVHPLDTEEEAGAVMTPPPAGEVAK